MRENRGNLDLGEACRKVFMVAGRVSENHSGLSEDGFKDLIRNQSERILRRVGKRGTSKQSEKECAWMAGIWIAFMVKYRGKRRETTLEMEENQCNLFKQEGG